MLDRPSFREFFGLARGRITAAALLSSAGICAGLLILERLTSEMLEMETRTFDNGILTSLRVPGDLSTPIGPRWLLHAVIDLNSLGSVTVLAVITMLAGCYLFVARRKAMALYLLVSVLGGWAISNAMKFLIARPRPDLVPHLQDVYDPSYPSGHAMMSAVTYLTIAALISSVTPERRTRMFLLASALLLSSAIGFCRIYLGVHYPTDVLAGWCAGAAWATICHAVGDRYIRQGCPVPSNAQIPPAPDT